MKIRQATLHDLPAIVAIYNETVPGRMVTADLEPVTVESRLPWFHAHEPKHRPLWVVEYEDNIIAWMSLQDFHTRCAYRHTAEISIYISEPHRGKGLGKELLGYAIANCAQLEVKTLIGLIFGHNTPSLKLFKDFGFEQWGYLPGVTDMEGTERDVAIVGKRVCP